MTEPYLIVGDGVADLKLWANLKEIRKCSVVFVRWGFLPDKVKERFHNELGLLPENEVENPAELEGIVRKFFGIKLE